MSRATTLTTRQRVDNYAHQDEVIHNYVERNCPTYMTPKQRRRVSKKSNRSMAKKMARFGSTFIAY